MEKEGITTGIMEVIKADAATTAIAQQILLINSAILAQNRVILEKFLNPRILLKPPVQTTGVEIPPKPIKAGGRVYSGKKK